MGNIITTNVDVKNTVKNAEKEDKELFDKILKKSQELYQKNKEEFMNPEFCNRIAITYAKKLYALPVEKVKDIYDKLETKNKNSANGLELTISYDNLDEEKFLVNELAGRLSENFKGKRVIPAEEFGGIKLSFPDIAYISNKTLSILDNIQKREFRKKEIAGGNPLFLDHSNGGAWNNNNDNNNENNIEEDFNENIEENFNRDRGRDRGRNRDFDRGRNRNFDKGRDRDFNKGRDRDFDKGRDRDFDRGRNRYNKGRDKGKNRFLPNEDIEFESAFKEEKNEPVNYKKFKSFKDELEAIKSEKPEEKKNYKPSNFIKEKEGNVKETVEAFPPKNKIVENKPVIVPVPETKPTYTPIEKPKMPEYKPPTFTEKPKFEKKPEEIQSLLEKKISELQVRKEKNMEASTDKYCLDERYPCKLTKKEMCEKIIYHFIVRNNLIATIASVVPTPNYSGDYSGSFPYDRLKSLNDGVFCLPPYYSDIQDTDDNIRIQKILKFLNILDEKECTTSGGYLLRLSEQRFKELMADQRLGKKYFEFIKKINANYKKSLEMLYNILEQLQNSTSLSTTALNELSRYTKDIIEDLYLKTQFNYLLAVLVVLDFDFIKNREMLEVKKKRIEKIIKGDFTNVST